MNVIAFVHFLAGIATLAVSWPLSKLKISMNAVYGFRTDAAFKSEQRWYDINAYGGKLLFRWGLAIIITSVIGLALPREFWIAYAWVSLVIILGGLSVLVFKTLRYADRLKK